MATFRDGAGREWQLSVTVATVKRVKETTGVHLTKLVDDQFKPLHDLLTDPVELVNTVFAMIQPQAQQIGITDEQFGESLTGDSVEQMAKAFVEALVDFFPSRQGQLLKNLIAKAERVQQMTLAKAEAEIEATTDEEFMNSVSNSLGS